MVGTTDARAAIARTKGPFLKGRSGYAFPRVPSGNTITERPPAMRAAASSYEANADLRLLRSIGTVPTARAPGPKIGILRSSALATKAKRGTIDPSTKTSNQLTWFEAKMRGQVTDSVNRSTPLIRTLTPEAKITAPVQVRAIQS